ncbi:MAG TPA: carboxypeptidase regulatory-like domain-containing protein [Longimicrobiaceae bacterium]|nr:carboxypeptidase regulatory-like domain-containing protein [Longimicrobiaceae bacterium]
MPLRLLPLLLALLLAPATLLAQVGVTTDILRGRVTGPDGAPVDQARVEATSAETGITRTTTTNEQGVYTLAFPDGGGRYQIRVSRAGFGEAVAVLAREADEDVLVANLRLGEAPVALEGIEVRGQRAPPPGRGETAAQERVISGEVASRLPLENTDAASLAVLAPGVVAVTQGDSLDQRGAFSVAGQRASLNQVTLDGASFASALTGGQAGGGSPLGIPQEGTRATQVVTTTFDVSRGQFAGGQVAITTRGGTNQPGGTFTYQLRDPLLAGNAGVSPLTGSFTQNRFSGGYGGPIVRNRLFYFVSGAVQRRSDDLFALTPSDPAVLETLGVSRDSVARFLSILGAEYGVATDGQTGAYRRVGDALSLLGRVDWTLSERHSLMVRGNLSSYTQDSTRIGFLELKQGGGEVGSGGGGGMATLTSRFGGGWINELRASINEDRRDLTSFAEVPEGRVRVTSLLPDGTRGVSQLSFGGDRSLPTTTRERTVEVSDELSLLFRDTHRIKAGALVNFTDFRQRIGSNVLGAFTFNSLDDFAAGRPASFTRSLAERETEGGGLNAALYLGDTWRPSRALQLTYGVRLEGSRFAGEPEHNPEVEALFGRRTDRIPTEVHVSPRAGFSLRLNEQGAPLRIVRGGIGEFRGRAPFALYAGALDQTGLSAGASQLVCIGAAVPAPDWPAYLEDPSRIPTTCADGGTGAPRDSGRRPTVTLFEDGFGAPRSWRGSLGFSAQLRPGLNASADASWVRGVNLFGVRDLNLARTPAFTLAAEGGRPVYASPAAIAPATGEVSFLGSRVHPEFGHVFALDSELASRTSQLTLALNGLLPPRVFFQGSYTLMRARDQSSFSCCTAQQGFASAPTGGDPNRPDWGTSDYERRHSFTLQAGMPVRPWLEVTLIGRTASGTPFTPMVGGDVNGDGARNDAAFVFAPATAPDTALADGMARLLASVPGSVRECLEEQAGSVAGRNSCRGPWTRSLDLRTTLRPNLPRIGRRLSVSLDASNVPAGLDLLVNGQGNLRGWGDAGRGRVDETLLYPRGFDPAAQRFRYEVNERFGQQRERRFAVGSPFAVQLSGRLTVGRNPGGGGLAGLGFGGGGGGGGGRFGGGGGGGGFRGERGEGPGRGIDADAILARVLPNPLPVILSLRDSLGLSDEQAARIAEISDSLRVRNQPIERAVRDAVQTAATGNEPGAIFQRIGPQLNTGRQNVRDALEEVRKTLTPEQWRKVPAALRNPFQGGFGGGRGGG